MDSKGLGRGIIWAWVIWLVVDVLMVTIMEQYVQAGMPRDAVYLLGTVATVSWTYLGLFGLLIVSVESDRPGRVG